MVVVDPVVNLMPLPRLRRSVFSCASSVLPLKMPWKKLSSMDQSINKLPTLMQGLSLSPILRA